MDPVGIGVRAAFVLSCILVTLLAGRSPAAALRAEKPYVFTDQAATLVFDPGQAPVDDRLTCRVRTITTSGWGPDAEYVVPVVGGRLQLEPIAEAIHIVTGVAAGGENVEARFLAVCPPPPMDARAVLRNLPRSGRKLLSGETYTILAMGDSITHTGDYESMFVMMLSRATKNDRIRFIDRSYPGRSVDAAVRFFEEDALPNQPDLGLLMYGLNDQICFAPLPAYLEQYEFIARRMAEELSADTVFMQPTPHIDINVKPPAGAGVEKGNPPRFAFRTIGFAESLRPLAARLDLPLAETFHALWGRGGDSVRESVRAMWPSYPTRYDRQMESMIETAGNGDTAHPGALGHLAMARAVFDAVSGRCWRPPLSFAGESFWTGQGVVSRLEVVNVSRSRRAGRLEVHAPFEGDLDSSDPFPYDLAPGESISIDARWSRVREAHDLLRHPANVYLAPGRPRLPVVDYHGSPEGSTSHVYAALAPVRPDASFVRKRSVVEGPRAHVWLLTSSGVRVREVGIPAGESAGRVPLVEKVTEGDRMGWAVAELAFTRFASAIRGEAQTDGVLGEDEWRSHVWSPLGEPCQARWLRGSEDNRASPGECYLHWAFKAGQRGIHIAVRAKGEVEGDRFTVFIDPRAPSLLGSVGRYYWFSGAIRGGGVLRLDKGETSKLDAGLTGSWRKTAAGSSLEMFVPYGLFQSASWPASGDLGLSIWWVHSGPEGKVTNLLWAEDGHPWNPRWYGVVRLQDDADESALPYVVRVK